MSSKESEQHFVAETDTTKMYGANGPLVVRQKGFNGAIGEGKNAPAQVVKPQNSSVPATPAPPPKKQ